LAFEPWLLNLSSQGWYYLTWDHPAHGGPLIEQMAQPRGAGTMAFPSAAVRCLFPSGHNRKVWPVCAVWGPLPRLPVASGSLADAVVSE